MGRYYSGDIEGKFWFGVQSSDDASSLGGFPEYVYGDEDVDGDEEERYEEDAIGLLYRFGPEQEEDLSEAIYKCKKELGEFIEKLDKFFEENDSYNDSNLALALGVDGSLGVDESKVRFLLVYYARLKFGEKIQNCLNENGQCNFTADLY
jgi:hypothetical protein